MYDIGQCPCTLFERNRLRHVWVRAQDMKNHNKMAAWQPYWIVSQQNLTRETSSSKTLIDHIYTNVNEFPIHAGTLITDISDHFPVFALVENIPAKLSHQNKFTYRNYKSYNSLNFCTYTLNKLIAVFTFPKFDPILTHSLAYFNITIFVFNFIISFLTLIKCC